jgi:hypothetical protein
MLAMPRFIKHHASTAVFNFNSGESMVVDCLGVVVKNVVPADVSKIADFFTRIIIVEVFKGEAVEVVNAAFPDSLLPLHLLDS